MRFVDVLILIVGGFIAGMTIRGGGPMIALGSMIGVRLSMRTLYTPMLIVSCLVLLRVILALRPRIHFNGSVMPSRHVLKAAAVGVLAMLLPLSPVLYAFGERLAFDNSVGTPVYWRSSPPGVDLLAFVLPNPNHALWGAPIQDLIVRMSQRPDGYPEFTASIPYVAIGLFVLAWWRFGWRPVPLPVVFPITFALLALGPFIQIAGVNTHIPTPWTFLRYVPLVGLARSPSRFAVLVMMGLSTLFALALVHITSRYAEARPDRRRMILAAMAALLVFELSPAPRTLYSAEIPAIYRTIASDPSPSVRVLGLPLGVRDGASSIGDYSALSQYYQTAHGKGILGGYISRVSDRRKHRLQTHSDVRRADDAQRRQAPVARTAAARRSHHRSLHHAHARQIRGRRPGAHAAGAAGLRVPDAGTDEDRRKRRPRALSRPSAAYAAGAVRRSSRLPRFASAAQDRELTEGPPRSAAAPPAATRAAGGLPGVCLRRITSDIRDCYDRK